MRDMLRGWVRFAAGIAEETGRTTVRTAKDLLDRGGLDVDALQRTLAEQVPAPVQSVAGDVLEVGRVGRDAVVGLVRSEAERTWHLVGRMGDQVVKAGVLLELLERKLREVEGSGSESPPPAPRARAETLFGADWQAEDVAAERSSVEPVRIPVEEEPEPGGPAAAEELATTRHTDRPTGGPAVEKPPAERTAVKKSAAKKAAVKKAAAKKAVTQKAAAQKAAAKHVAAKQPSAKQASVRQAAARQTAVAKKAAKQAPAERAVTTKAAAKKAATTKASAKKPAAPKTTGRKPTEGRVADDG